jgi:hypothetical protein
MDSEDEKPIRSVLSDFKDRFNFRTVHWRKITDFYKKAYLVKQLSAQNFRCVNIVFDTQKADRDKIRDMVFVYNFMCKYLLERASWHIKDAGKTAKIIISGRGTNEDKRLVEYIENKLIPYKGNAVKDVFTGVAVKSATDWDMLQLADVCASATFSGFETNRLGFVTPCHLNRLSEKLYRHDSKVLGYGIKYYIDDMKPEVGYFESRKICNRKK